MTAKAFKVLISDYAWPEITVEQSILEPIAELICAPDTKESTLLELIPEANALMFNWAQITPKVVRAAKNCLVMSRFGVGLDNLPVALATKQGILVTNIPDYCVHEVSEHTLALIFTLIRRIIPFDQLSRQGHGSDVNLAMPINRLKGSCLGVLGFGRIGRVVVQKAQALGMTVLVTDHSANSAEIAQAGGMKVHFEQLLSTADILSLHVPLTAQTEHLIGEDALRRMKPSALLINVARGGIIDTTALIRALDEGWIAGAGLDVLDEEPIPATHPLTRKRNVLLTPHVAFFSQQSLEELTRRCAWQVRQVLEKQKPENICNPEVLPQARVQFETYKQ